MLHKTYILKRKINTVFVPVNNNYYYKCVGTVVTKIVYTN